MNGILLVDKPSGLTSHDVVAQVRKIFQTRSVGHSGTLDPIATGLLAVLVGEATKLSDYITSEDKTYLVRIHLGVETDTLDREGEVTRASEAVTDRGLIEAALNELNGTHELVVPAYSAAKVAGRKLYEYARSGETVPQILKKMTFSEVKWVGGESPLIDVEVRTTKGGFIRSFASELGRRLGCGASVAELRRIKSAPYHVHSAVALDVLAERLAQGELGTAWVSLEAALPSWSVYSVKAREEFLLRNGQISHELGNRMMPEQKLAIESQSSVGIKVVGEAGKLLGLLEMSPGRGLKIRRILSTHGLDPAGQVP